MQGRVEVGVRMCRVGLCGVRVRARSVRGRVGACGGSGLVREEEEVAVALSCQPGPKEAIIA